MNYFIIAQIFGIIMIILDVISPQMKTKKAIIFVVIFVNLAGTLQFVFLGKWTGIITTFIALVRTLIYYFYASKSRRAPIWMLIVLMVIQLGSVIWTWDSWYAIFMLLTVANIYGQWQINSQITRGGIMITGLGIGVYSVFSEAYTGALDMALRIVSSGIALWRYRKRKELEI